MENKMIRFDTSELMRMIHERIGLGRFTLAMRIGERRLTGLLFGIEQFSQDEMLLAAKLLHLSNDEFNRCFFTAHSSENLN